MPCHQKNQPMKQPMRISCSCDWVAGLEGKPCVRQGPLVSFNRGFHGFHGYKKSVSSVVKSTFHSSYAGPRNIRDRAPGECTNLLRQNPTTHPRLNRIMNSLGYESAGSSRSGAALGRSLTKSDSLSAFGGTGGTL